MDNLYPDYIQLIDLPLSPKGTIWEHQSGDNWLAKLESLPMTVRPWINVLKYTGHFAPIEEKEFTRAQMILFAKECRKFCWIDISINNIDRWLKKIQENEAGQ